MKITELGQSVAVACALATGMLSGHATAENAGGWEYAVAPMYLWGKNLDGVTSLGGMEAPLELDFKNDIVENLEAAFAIHFEAKQGNLSLFAEYNYAHLDPTAEIPLGPVTLEADVTFKDTMWELGAAYAFYDSGSTQWEVLGGLRYMDQELVVDLNLPDDFALPLPSKIKGGDDWWHGFGGMRVTTKLSERWSFRARADLGYKDSNNTAVNGMGSFDYRYRDWVSFFAGYRYLNADYSNKKSGAKEYSADLVQKGPIIGAFFYF